VLAGYHGDPLDTNDISQDDFDKAVDEAVSMAENVFGDRVLFTSELDDENNAVKLLCRHKLALALGDTIDSEGQAGSNVTYVGTGNGRSLMRTEYGMEFLEYTRDQPNVAAFKTR